MIVSDIVVGAGEAINELPMPTWGYGIVFLSAFFVMALVTYSYRNVANRHRNKTGGSGVSPAGHH